MNRILYVIWICFSPPTGANVIVDVFTLREISIPSADVPTKEELYENAEYHCQITMEEVIGYKVVDLMFDDVGQTLGCYVEVRKETGDDSDVTWLAKMNRELNSNDRYTFVAVTPHQVHTIMSNEGDYAFLAELHSKAKISNINVIDKIHIGKFKSEPVDVIHGVWSFRMEIDEKERLKKGLKRNWMHVMELLAEVCQVLTMRVRNFHRITFQTGLSQSLRHVVFSVFSLFSFCFH
ncbi:hypothetical protein CRM22_006206 [Opisthorchis felineus]|uniref:Uncharacterized protein n=1 Tax=Opisthorchis felineus TaxID=147828 RepID=A0A4S2LTJ0_OPIFE|nr:hypothetical protein CRM22_006206 [Opisthorchis felineus]